MKKYFLSAIIFISSLSLSAQSAQWTTLSIATGNDITHCSFPSNDTGFSTSGKIYRTFDGGISFDSVSIPGMSQIDCIHFRSNTSGAACGTLSAGGIGVFRTPDSGTNWVDRTPAGAVGTAMQVRFPDQFHGVLLTSAPGIYATQDGGFNWTNVQFGFDYFNAVDFPTGFTGYIGGFDGTFNYVGVIKKTTDGGATWSSTANFTQNNTDIQQIQFINADTGFASYNPFSFQAHLIRTRDGAVSWDTVLFTHGQIIQFAFRDYMNGFIVNDSGSIYRTFDAGVNWVLDRPHTNYLYDIKVTPNYAYSVGASGLFVKRDLFSAVCECYDDLNVKIYPNPSTDKITVHLPHATEAKTVSVMDITGKNCGNLSFSQGNADEITLDTHSLANGYYIMEITTKDQIFRTKFEKAY